jgi:hypothetical protein
VLSKGANITVDSNCHRAGPLSVPEFLASLLLGAGYHTVPLTYLAVRWLSRRAPSWTLPCRR